LHLTPRTNMMRQTKNQMLQDGLKKKGGIRRNWQRRWFVLLENWLFYAKKPNVEPQGVLNLIHAKTVPVEGPGVRPNSFTILSQRSVSADSVWVGRTYEISASSNEERMRWIEAINKAAQSNRPSKMIDEQSKTSKKSKSAHDQSSSEEEDDESRKENTKNKQKLKKMKHIQNKKLNKSHYRQEDIRMHFRKEKKAKY